MPRKPRVFGKTSKQRAYDLRRAGDKRNREARERTERRQRQLAKRGYRMGCLIPAVLIVATAALRALRPR
jgi:hypothetical protein